MDLHSLSIAGLRARIDTLDADNDKLQARWSHEPRAHARRVIEDDIFANEAERACTLNHLNKRLAEAERIRIECERPVPSGC